MGKYVKALLALFGLLLLCGALFVFGGGLNRVFAEDIEGLKKRSAAAEVEISEAAGIKATVDATVTIVTGDEPPGYKVVVTYDFLPPGVDRLALYRAAEGPVKKHFANLLSFKVTNIQAPAPQHPLAPPPPLEPTAFAEPPPEPPPAEPQKPAVTGKKPAAKGGTLTLFTIPAGAVVTLKGKELGKTPLLKVPVPAGTQLLQLVFPDGTRKKLSAKISPNQLAKFKFDKDELPDQ